MIRCGYFMILLFLCFLGIVTAELQGETFSEELLVRPLNDGNLLAHLQFTTTIDYPTDGSSLNHFQLFPKSVAQVIQKYNVEELRLAFTQGRWKHNKWGVPILDAPSGVQIASSFWSTENLEHDWEGLIHSLSGMFCASLSSLKETARADPHFSFTEMRTFNPFVNEKEKSDEQYEWQQELLDEIEEAMAERSEALPSEWEEMKSLDPAIINHLRNRYRVATQMVEESSGIMYGEMPEEAVCTENLTPWSKLLPCNSNSGLGKLLHSLPLYSALYHSMGVDIRFNLPDGCNTVLGCKDKVTLELIQTLSLVFDTENETHINVAQLFDDRGMSSCALSQGNSYVYIQLPDSDEKEYEISPSNTIHLENGLEMIKLDEALRLVLSRIPGSYHKRSPDLLSPILIKKSALGYGEQHGGILTEITNPTNFNQSVTYFEYIPWYFPIYFHSLRIFLNNEILPIGDISSQYRFQPSEDHSIPSIIEITFEIPAQSTIVFTYRYDQAFLQWTEHPPDAHRGSDIPSSSVAIQYDSKPKELMISGLEWSPMLYNNTEDRSYTFRVYSEGLLILLPTPDFSMPYNVITLTCTMFAIIFTTTINVLTRKFSYLRKGGEYSSGRLSLFLYRKVRDFIAK